MIMYPKNPVTLNRHTRFINKKGFECLIVEKSLVPANNQRAVVNIWKADKAHPYRKDHFYSIQSDDVETATRAAAWLVGRIHMLEQAYGPGEVVVVDRKGWGK